VTSAKSRGRFTPCPMTAEKKEKGKTEIAEKGADLDAFLHTP